MHASMFNDLPDPVKLMKGCGCVVAVAVILAIATGILIGKYGL